jgi:hypothetical protein
VQIEKKKEKESWTRRGRGRRKREKDLRTARYAFILRVLVKCCCG